MDEDDRAVKRDAKKARRAARFERTQRESAIKALMASTDGRTFLYWLLAECHVGHSPFATNALVMSFSCGEQNVGLKLQGLIIELCPENYLVMLKEKQNAGTPDDTFDDTGDDAPDVD
jgi:hypothetical protein